MDLSKTKPSDYYFQIYDPGYDMPEQVTLALRESWDKGSEDPVLDVQTLPSGLLPSYLEH